MLVHDFRLLLLTESMWADIIVNLDTLTKSASRPKRKITPSKALADKDRSNILQRNILHRPQI